MAADSPDRLDDALLGVLLGTAVGDSLGLPWEALPAHRIPRALPRTPISGRLSDDTEQTALVAEALLASQELDGFRRALAGGLRRWMLGLPVGVGFGTLRACLKLLVGFPPHKSGVRSAGNGAAMRAAVLGLVVPEDALPAWVEAASRVTHCEPRAIDGAWVVAMAARVGASAGHAGKRARSAELLAAAQTSELKAALQTVLQAVERQDSPEALVQALGIEGFVTGYVLHTVPVALFLWLRYDDAETAIASAVRLGGDTDTVAAITGALQGATGGASGLPWAWIEGLRDAPVSRERLEALAASLARRTRGEGVLPPTRLRWRQWLLRSLAFIPVVLFWLLARRLWLWRALA